jgi:hypothetical protein
MAGEWTLTGYTEPHSKTSELSFTVTYEPDPAATPVEVVESVSVSDPAGILTITDNGTSSDVYGSVADLGALFDQLSINYNYLDEPSNVFTVNRIDDVPSDANLFEYNTDPRATITVSLDATAVTDTSTYSTSFDIVIQNNWSADGTALRAFINNQTGN